MTHTKVINRQWLAAETALELVRLGITEGARAGISVSVAVCGPGMELLAFGKADSATPHSAETSRRKAQTSASTRRATGWMSPSLAVELPMASGNLLTNIPGGMPIVIDGAFVGAIGIAGGTVEQDAAIAAAALLAIGATEGR